MADEETPTVPPTDPIGDDTKIEGAPADPVVPPEPAKPKSAFGKILAAVTALGVGATTLGGSIFYSATHEPAKVDGVIIDKDFAPIAVVADVRQEYSEKIKMVSDGEEMKPDTIITPEAIKLESHAEIVEYAVAGDSVMLCYLKRGVNDTTWVMGDKTLFVPTIPLPEGQCHKIAIRPNDFAIVNIPVKVE